MSTCRACNAPIRWTKTERGRRMPLDAAPYTGADPRGLFVLRGEVAIAVPPDVFPGEPHYRSHFATCPEASEFRRD